MADWAVEQVVHFEPGEFVKSGLAHFGFHVRDGRYYAIAHQDHYLGLVDSGGQVVWTVAPQSVVEGVPNIRAELNFPIFVDSMADGALVVSNFGNANLYRIDPGKMASGLLIDGKRLGMADMGNCVVDGDNCIWVNEVTGRRVWRFDGDGHRLELLGDGNPGFDSDEVAFDAVRFDWIYDMRRAPNGNMWVLDSRNFALREIDISSRTVRNLAGTGLPGYTGDGGSAVLATFGGDATAKFNGPISLSIDEAGNAYVGDRFNHVVRIIERASGVISTIAGRPDARDDAANDPQQRDPLQLNLPMISSMDYAAGRLFVPTDLEGDAGDLTIMRRT